MDTNFIRLILISLSLSMTTACVPLWTGSAMQEDIDRLEARQKALDENFAEKQKEISEMAAQARKDVDELNRVLEEATALFQRNNADFGAEITETRSEMQRLRGDVEELNFKMQKLRQDLQLFKEDVDIRFASGGGAQLPEEKEELFAFAEKEFGAKNYRIARRAYETFSTKFSKDRRAAEAVYKMGDTYFQEGQWVSGVFEFQKVLQQFSRSAWVDDATYKIGASFQKLGKCAEARVFYESVVKDHPNSKWADDARRALKTIKGDSC